MHRVSLNGDLLLTTTRLLEGKRRHDTQKSTAVFKCLVCHVNRLLAHNKEIVDSRLRPQSCCHLANFIEMQEIVDC